MNKTRFIVSICATLTITIWGTIMGSNIWLYIDAASAVFSPLLAFIVISLIYSPKEQVKFLKEIFKPQGEGNKKELERAITYLSTYRNLLILTTLLAVFIGIIGMMANLEDATSVGRNFGVVCVSLFYGILFLLTVIEPLKGAAKKSLNS